MKTLKNKTKQKKPKRNTHKTTKQKIKKRPTPCF